MITGLPNWMGKHDEFKALFPQSSDTTIIKNCGPYPFLGARPPEPDALTEPSKGLRASKRIRQSSKPVMNRLEREFYSKLTFPFTPPSIEHLRHHAFKFCLANGCWFLPDITCIRFGRFTCFEVKGKQPIQDDAVVKIKIAAKEYPDFDWVLVWKGDDGQWKEQRILA